MKLTSVLWGSCFVVVVVFFPFSAFGVWVFAVYFLCFSYPCISGGLKVNSLVCGRQTANNVNFWSLLPFPVGRANFQPLKQNSQ